MNRQKVIIRTGIIGILANVFLAGFKAAVGLISGSIAVTLDAVNNLSDALSSVITIVSAKLAGKRPDKKHPYGHGRIEYLSAVTIAVIVLYAGITSLVESVKKIIHPEAADYSAAALIIIAVAVVVKIVLGIYVKKTGEQVNSDSLVAAAIYLIWGVSLEAWLAALISLVIIKSGIDMLREGLSLILGERVESEVSAQIREAIHSFPAVLGVYDLILHNYGPEYMLGSVHIEVDEHMTAKELDVLERQIAEKVYAETGVGMAGIGIYARVSDNAFSRQVYADLRDITAAYPSVLQMHGFTADRETKQIRFDLVMDYDEKKREQIFQDIVVKISEKYPDYNIYPVLDADITDI